MCAAREGATFLGYIFYPPSKRFIAPRRARDITTAVRAEFPDVQHVGVFVDEEPANVAWTANLAGLDLVQLHGKETPEYCAELDLMGLRIVKTISIGADGAALDASAYCAEFFLCDTHDEQLKGGTGRRFDLSKLPSSISANQLFLAGGLSPDNIGELLSEVRPYAVDVSSGVEVRPGVKSHRAVKEFLQAVRRASGAANNSSQETNASNVI